MRSRSCSVLASIGVAEEGKRERGRERCYLLLTFDVFGFSFHSVTDAAKLNK